MILRPIEARSLGMEWDRVRTGLVEVKAATTDDWLPEDVYMSIKSGGATLYIGESDGEYLGFLVLRLVQTFHGAKVEIWCAHSATKTHLMHVFWPQIQALASQAGASRIGFSSARAEWKTVATRLGFAPTQVQYEFTL